MPSKTYKGFPSMTAFIQDQMANGASVDEIASIMHRSRDEVAALIRLRKKNVAKRAAKMSAGEVTIPHEVALKVCAEAQRLNMYPTALARVLIASAVNTGRVDELVKAHGSLM